MTETDQTTLAGKIVWVTGGGSGIGAAGAMALADAGATVIVSGRRPDAVADVAATINAAGGKAEALALDIADDDAVKQVSEGIIARHGRIDILVASAGVNVTRRSFEELDPNDWRQLIDINLSGAMYCIQAVRPSMRARKDGLVIIIASWAGRHPGRLAGPAYNASKAAVLALAHTFNAEECINGLRATVISPGDVMTDLILRRAVPPPVEERERLLQPDDLGRTIRFVAELPPRVCINEILISPTWNRAFIP